MKLSNSKRTGGIRMKKMLDSGLLKVVGGGNFIDLYNMIVLDDIACSITTRVDSCNHYWVKEVYET